MIILSKHKEFQPYIICLLTIKNTILYSLLILLSFFCVPNYLNSQEKPFIVVLDAGHGGHDTGNRGNGYYEKKIALNISLKTGKKLEKIKGFKVIYTRKTDVFVDLIERANIANRVDADLFISIHCDAFTSSKVYGAGTFVLGLHENERNFKVAQKENSVIFLEKDFEKKYDGFNPNDPQSVISLLLMQQTYLNQSIAAASSFQESFVNNLKRKDRKVKQAGFIVLKYTYMPSVLVETGFLTNPSEGAYLNSSKGQENMSNALSKAIINYRNIRDASYIDNNIELVNKKVEKQDNDLLKANIKFKVQIAASKNKLDLKPYNFSGLNSITRLKSGKLYRYYYSETSTYKKALNKLNEAKSKGYLNSFIVAFDDDKIISITKAQQLLK
tara:strand:+ start:813 stop:1970 length:1158 start_codon:yes stop_codon:yes gene_type:complete